MFLMRIAEGGLSGAHISMWILLALLTSLRLPPRTTGKIIRVVYSKMYATNMPAAAPNMHLACPIEAS
eukprot:6176740-Pleurochrysis_carterae.AAC.1